MNPGAKSVIYQIRIEGHLDERWLRWLAGVDVSPLPEGETIISGETDQAQACRKNIYFIGGLAPNEAKQKPGEEHEHSKQNEFCAPGRCAVDLLIRSEFPGFLGKNG